MSKTELSELKKTGQDVRKRNILAQLEKAGFEPEVINTNPQERSE